MPCANFKWCENKINYILRNVPKGSVQTLKKGKRNFCVRNQGRNPVIQLLCLTPSQIRISVHNININEDILPILSTYLLWILRNVIISRDFLEMATFRSINIDIGSQTFGNVIHSAIYVTELFAMNFR